MGDTATRTERNGVARPDPDLPRPLWSLRAVALVVGLPSLLLAAFVGAQLLDRRELSSATLAGPVERVVIQVARGDVQLEPAADGSTDLVVETTSRWRFIRPESTTTIDESSGVARIRGGCPRIVIVIGTCAVDYVVQVPSGAQVYVRTDNGTVRAEGLDGWVRVTTSGGDVTAADLRSPELLVQSSGGDVDAGFVATPSRVELLTEGGAVVLQVPDGAPYDVNTRGSTGTVDVGVPTSPGAERTIRVDSDDGEVVISVR